MKFSSYVGGSGWDTIHFIEVDSYDNVLTAGIGGPDGFPIRNAIQKENRGSVDVVLMIVSPTCQPFFCSYFGGSAEDSPLNIFVLDNKSLIVGFTKSLDFPVSNNSFQQEIGGEDDGFFLFFNYISYLEAHGINTRPSKTPGFTLVILGLGVLWLVMVKTKK